jgi:hypothetical protein
MGNGMYCTVHCSSAAGDIPWDIVLLQGPVLRYFYNWGTYGDWRDSPFHSYIGSL